ncbi:MAG: S9 family peptidase [Phycisphaerae bacterium]
MNCRIESSTRTASLHMAAGMAAVWVLSVAVIAADTELLPRKLIFGNPDRNSPKLSPDGKNLAYLAPVNGVMNIWVGPLDDPKQAQAVTDDTKRGIRQYFWAYNNEQVIYLQDTGGDENWRVYAVNVKTKESKDLTPLKGVQARIQEVSPKFPGEILVAINDRVPQFHDVYRVNLASGERTLVAKNDEKENRFAAYLTDEDYRVRFAMRLTPDGGSELLQRGDGDTWESFTKIPQADSLTTNAVGFDKTGDTIYIIDSRGRDTAALTAVDVKTNAAKVLAEDARADAGDIVIHPTSKIVQAVGFEYERQEWKILDPAFEKDFAALRKAAEGDIDIVSRSLDDSRWIVAFVQDNGPVRWFRFDRDTQKATFLFTNRPALEGKPLARMYPQVIPARDGLKLVSFLTLPVAADAAGKGRPDKPQPMVLLVHGGPWGRDSWGFNGLHQWLANRGYAVLSVNFRGSTGLGKKFVNAADKEWAGKMHDDLLDAVQWAVKENIADAKRVVIMGGSYGGYATLVGLTFTPEVFAAGVDIVGPSSLVTLLESIPPYWQPMIDMFATRVGDHRNDEGRAFLLSRSPLSRVDAIKRPLLIGQGANDPRVKQAEADQIVKALKERNIPVTYVLFPDEGHGFARPENSLAFWAVTEAFLSKHVGGRFEPIGDDFHGSSISVPEGGEIVPGLKDAMKPQ